MLLACGTIREQLYLLPENMYDMIQN